MPAPLRVIILLLPLWVVNAAAAAAGLAGGALHSLRLASDGVAWSWGANFYGQLGTGDSSPRGEPAFVLDHVQALSAGAGHNLFLREDGTAWACGRNNYGQFGTGDTTPAVVPIRVLTDVRAVSAGLGHSLFLKTDGSAWAAGRNTEGALGDGTHTDRPARVRILAGVAALSAGARHSLFLKTDGTAWAVGGNEVGQLGTGNTTATPTPVRVLDEVQAVAAGGTLSLFLKTDGTLWLSGDNTGRSIVLDRLHSPAKVLDHVQAIAAGTGHWLALREDGSVWAAGTNSEGQLGDGTTDFRDLPTRVMDGVRAIAAGGAHSLFLKTNGIVRACGSNAWSQLGDGSTQDRLRPVVVDLPVPQPQSITFSPDATTAYTARPIAFDATASSGLPVIYEVVSGPARLDDGRLVLTGLGSVTVRATQPGDATHLPAPAVERVIKVEKSVTLVALGKSRRHTQSIADRTTLADKSAFGFAIDLDAGSGNRIRTASATLSPVPTLVLPSSSTFATTTGRTSALGLGTDADDGWNFGAAGADLFDQWTTSSSGKLDALFPAGTYGFSAQGRRFTLRLPTTDYPPQPRLLLDGGRWMASGRYRLRADRPLSIRTTAFTGYGDHANDVIWMDLADAETGAAQLDIAQSARALPPYHTTIDASRRITHSIPAGTLLAGHRYELAAGFVACASQTKPLPGAVAVVYFETQTALVIEVVAP